MQDQRSNKKHVMQVNSIEGRVSGDMNRTELIISKVDHSCNWKVTSFLENNSSTTKSITFIPDEYNNYCEVEKWCL